MKKSALLTFTALLATSTAIYAANDHEHTDASPQPNATMEMGGSSMMGAMSPEMQSKMHKMKADMMAIQKEKNPQKRKAMMSTHMKDMKNMMNMMKSERKMMQDKHINQMNQLEKRVTMMEAMMEQVVSTHITSLDPDDPVYKIDTMD